MCLRPANVEEHLLQGLAAHPRTCRAAAHRHARHPASLGTAHKTVATFMRYVHTEDDPVRAAADAVAFRRQGLIGGAAIAGAANSSPAPIFAPDTVARSTADGDKPLAFDDGNYRSRTRLGNYRPFRHRRGPNRATPLGTKRNATEAKEVADLAP